MRLNGGSGSDKRLFLRAKEDLERKNWIGELGGVDLPEIKPEILRRRRDGVSIRGAKKKESKTEMGSPRGEGDGFGRTQRESCLV